MADDYAKKYLQRHDRLKTNRSSLHAELQDVVDYVRPTAGSFLTPSGESPNQPTTAGTNKRFDDTAVDCMHKFATGIMSLTCRQDDLWFDLSTGNPTLDARDDVRLWLFQATSALYDIFDAPKLGFYPSAHKVVLELGSFGTCITGQFRSSKNFINFNTRFMGECYIAQDGDEDVDTVHREFKVPAYDFQRMFNMVPEVVQKSISAGRPDDMFTVVHCVTPRDVSDIVSGSKTPGNKPYTHDYFLKDTAETLMRGGHDEFPYQVPRWTVFAGDTYGRSPAMEAMPSIRMLNQMSKDNIKVGNLAADPAWQVPDDGFMLPLRASPRAINYYRAGTDDRAELLRKDYGAVPFAAELQAQKTLSVQRMFYTDLMLSVMNKNKEMTLGEVQQVVEEQARMIVPYVLGLQQNWLSPAIDRVFAIAYRAGKIPPPPAAIQNRDLVVNYRSPITQAQRSVYAVRLQRAFQLITPLAQQDPSILDNLNSDRTTKWLLQDVFGIPQSIMNSEDEKNQIRTARASASMKQQAKDDALNAANAYATVTKANAAQTAAGAGA